jgi:hypothetical protein
LSETQQEAPPEEVPGEIATVEEPRTIEPVPDPIPRLQIETFSATHVKHLAVLLLKITKDPELKQAISWMFENRDAPGEIAKMQTSLVYTFLGASLEQATDQLDAFLASLLNISVEEFGKQDAEVYPETIAALVDHPKFKGFLKSGRGMFAVIGSKWSSFSPSDTDGPSNTSNPSNSSNSTD